MFNKALIVCGFGIVVLGIGIFYFLTQPKGPQEIPAEARALLEKIYAYSGTLTLEEQRQFAEFPSMLEAIDSRQPLPKSELTRLEAHFREVYNDNPELNVCEASTCPRLGFRDRQACRRHQGINFKD